MSIIALDNSSVMAHNTPSMSSRSMFYYMQSCGHYKCKKPYFTDRKDYNSFLLVYTINGKGYLTYRDKSFTLHRGQGFLIDCNEQQYYSTDADELWEFKYIHFNGCESKKYFDRIVENTGFVFNLDKDCVTVLNIDRLFNMYLNNEGKNDALCSCLIVEILTELLIGSASNITSPNIPDYIDKAITRIENDYEMKLSLEDIAKGLNINKYHLTKQFKRFTGKSLYEYLINHRLAMSKELLKSTQMPVSEIACKVGFDSTSHYIKLFRQHEEITPCKFRKYWG